jgi:alkylated DNA repair dioxygenase AlkB
LITVIFFVIFFQWIEKAPKQLTINYYKPDEGLEPHTDNPKIIKELVVGNSDNVVTNNYFSGFSLSSPRIMTFTNNLTKEVIEVLLEPRSVMIQKGQVRYDWAHGIEPGHSKMVIFQLESFVIF